jgi:glycosyltransferase involved in cell wall biosynthesis
MKLSVVLPVRDEAPVIPDLIPRLTGALEGLDETWEVILVDDGSRDSTWAQLKDAADRDERIRAIRFSRNFGHQIALSAGPPRVGDAVVTMDSDLQHRRADRSLLAKAAAATSSMPSGWTDSASSSATPRGSSTGCSAG